MSRNAIIIEDSDIPRYALRTLLNEMKVKVLAECDRYADSVKAIIKYQPNLVILDHHLLDCKGVDIYKTTKNTVKETHFLYATADGSLATMLDIIESGITNIVIKSYLLRIKNAIQSIVDGKTYMDHDVSKNILIYNNLISKLSISEKNVIKLFLQKKKIDEIAEITHLSDGTIKRKKANIILKLGRNHFNRICCM